MMGLFSCRDNPIKELPDGVGKIVIPAECFNVKSLIPTEGIHGEKSRLQLNCDNSVGRALYFEYDMNSRKGWERYEYESSK